VEPRNFVPTYFESFYAPGFGWWYQYGGLHGDPAANRPNAVEPPRGHPLRRAMELLDETSMMTREADRITHFNAVQEIAADNVWTISIRRTRSEGKECSKQHGRHWHRVQRFS